MFGCTAYVQRLPRGAQFQSRELEGVYLENIEHGVHKVHARDGNGSSRVVESRHVTFNESKLLGAPDLQHSVSDESASDDDVFSDSNIGEASKTGAETT